MSNIILHVLLTRLPLLLANLSLLRSLLGGFTLVIFAVYLVLFLKAIRFAGDKSELRPAPVKKMRQPF